jgi:hypothetical protein
VRLGRFARPAQDGSAAHDGGGRELADGDVIDVAVGAFGPERDHHVRLDAADVAGDRAIASRRSTWSSAPSG